MFPTSREKQMRSLLTRECNRCSCRLRRRSTTRRQRTNSCSILGTAWFVLRVPHVRDDGRIRTSAYDGRRFRHMEPVNRLRTCDTTTIPSVPSRTKNVDCSPRTPRMAIQELDDVVIANLASLTGLPVATNDRELQKIVVDGRASIHRAMRAHGLDDPHETHARTKRGWKD